MLSSCSTTHCHSLFLKAFMWNGFYKITCFWHIYSTSKHIVDHWKKYWFSRILKSTQQYSKLSVCSSISNFELILFRVHFIMTFNEFLVFQSSLLSFSLSSFQSLIIVASLPLTHWVRTVLRWAGCTFSNYPNWERLPSISPLGITGTLKITLPHRKC